jgi:NifU-like protein involved in Fe-S cluster formation
MNKENETNWIYSDAVKEHFFHPHNVLIDEENYIADGVGEVGSPECGDVMQVWIKVDSATQKIIDFKWKTFGCASAIASTSILSIMVLENDGMQIDDAYKIKPKDIIDRLGGLPAHKMHCSVLGDRALRAAIDDYRKKSI